jgi:hypothetical protein
VELVLDFVDALLEFGDFEAEFLGSLATSSILTLRLFSSSLIRILFRSRRTLA